MRCYKIVIQLYQAYNSNLFSPKLPYLDFPENEV